MKLGCHLGLDKYMKIVSVAEKLETNTFQIFLRSPMGGTLQPIDYNDIEEFKKYQKTNNFGPILVHGPFIANGASDKENIRINAGNLIHEDLKRLNLIPNSLYVIHPGCHMKQGVDFGIEEISKMLNFAMFKGQNSILLLETMSGKGTEIGRNFEELKSIIDNVNMKENIGICLDTCHIWDGGYDIQNNLDEVLKEFDNILGLEKLKAIHLNNSSNALNSHKDHHAGLLDGTMNKETFIKITNHPLLKEVPFYLETPIADYKEDITFIKNNLK